MNTNHTLMPDFNEILLVVLELKHKETNMGSLLAVFLMYFV
jgi:hypothetical protein